MCRINEPFRLSSIVIIKYLQVVDTLDASLDEKFEAEVYGVREQLLDKNTVAMVLILCDILGPVIRFSDHLQTSQIIISDVMTRSQVCLSK